MSSLRLPVEVEVVISSFATSLASASSVASVSRSALAAVRDARTWAQRQVTLHDLTFSTRGMRGLGHILSSAAEVTVCAAQMPDTLRWDRGFCVSWAMSPPFQDSASVVLAEGLRHAVSGSIAPFEFGFHLRWAGRLQGVQVGLRSEPNILEERGHLDQPGIRSPSLHRAIGLALHPDLPNTLPLWTWEGQREHTANVQDARPNVISSPGYEELGICIRWSQCHFTVKLDSGPAWTLRTIPGSLHPRSRLVLSFYWRATQMVRVAICPRRLLTMMHLPRPKALDLPCGSCWRQAPDVCAICNEGFCLEHGGLCVPCGFFGCIRCLASHTHAVAL
jgi:hypothetical protein